MTPRTAEITLTVDLDANNVARSIAWQATEAGDPQASRCEALMLSLWDRERRTTAAIDLWTPEMTIEEMNAFVHQVLHRLADTYQRATRQAAAAQSIHDLAEAFDAAVNPESSAASAQHDSRVASCTSEPPR